MISIICKAQLHASRFSLQAWPILCNLVVILVAFGGLVAIEPPVLIAQNANRSTVVTADADLYYRIFHHVAVLKSVADTAQQQGKDRSNLRQIVRLRAGLTDLEGQILERTSVQCDGDVLAQDAKAKKIIGQFHAQYPPGVINPSFPPKAPLELDAMWQERQKIILQARDNLRSALGEETYARFDQFVRSGQVPGIRSSTAVSLGTKQQ